MDLILREGYGIKYTMIKILHMPKNAG
jgi:hypothetical protein